MELKEIKEMIRFCKKNGVNHLKHDGLEFRFAEYDYNYEEPKALSEDEQKLEDELAAELLVVEDPVAWEDQAMGDN